MRKRPLSLIVVLFLVGSLLVSFFPAFVYAGDGSSITYPIITTTDIDKLKAIYSLLEQMRLEHNRQGDIAEGDWLNDIGKWQTYKEVFAKKQLPLLEEQGRLRNLIRESYYTDEQWDNLKADQKDAALVMMYGDRANLKKQATLASSILIDQLKAIDLSKLTGTYFDPTENFTAYTEQDASGHLTETASRVTFTAMACDTVDTYLYKDYGANFFNSLNINFEIYIQNEAVNINGHAGIAVTNTLSSAVGFGVNDVWMALQPKGGNVIWVRLVRGDFTETDYYVGSAATLYYINLSRTASSATVTGRIYAEAAHTTLLDTIVLTGLAGATKWQYSMGCVNYHDGTANRVATGYTQNMDLNYNNPVITTGAASLITDSTARLSGNLTDAGTENATVNVYWGLTDGGTNFAAWTNNSTPTLPTQPQIEATFYKDATPLNPFTLYYFNTSAINSLGDISWGTSANFTTLVEAPTVVTNAVIGANTTSASFLGSGNITSVNGSNATSVGFEYGLSTGNYTANATSVGAYLVGEFRVTVSGLSANTTYYYRAWAVNASGIGVGAELTVTTLAEVTNFRGVVTSDTMILTWQPPSGSTNTTILYSTNTFPTSVANGVVLYTGGGFQTTASNLTPGQVYYFTAFSGSGAPAGTGVHLVLTTSAVDIPSGAAKKATNIIPIPTLPTSIDQPSSVPPGSNLQPFTNIFAFFASGNLTVADNATAGGGLGMPIGNVWELISIFGLVSAGMAVYIKIKNFFVAFFVVFVLTVILVAFHLTQAWLVPIELIVGLGVWALDKYFQ